MSEQPFPIIGKLRRQLLELVRALDDQQLPLVRRSPRP